MNTISTGRSGLASVLVSVALFYGGCSSSTPSAAGGGGKGGTTTSGGSPCKAIAQVDAQAILTNPITSLEDDSAFFACVFRYSGGSQGDSLQIVWDPNDTDLSSYNTLKGSDDHVLPGVGDEAYWNQAVDGVTIPSVTARKGNVTCTIQPPDPPDSTCKTTAGGSPIGYTIAESDGAVFATLLGKVCTDVFTAF